MREARNARRGQRRVDGKGSGGGKGTDVDLDSSIILRLSSLGSTVLRDRERPPRHCVR
jgi:hypothetical protein